MEAVHADIANLNQSVLKALTHPRHAAWVRSHWDVQDKALELLQDAKISHIECIAGCGVPIFEVRVPQDPTARPEPVPEEVAKLHLWVLLSVVRACWIDHTAAATLFRAPADALWRLRSWPMMTIRLAACHHADVLRIGRTRSISFWRKLLDGAQVGGGTGAHLVRTLLLMGTT